MSPVRGIVRRPQAATVPTAAAAAIPGTPEYIRNILKDIDPALMVDERTGKNMQTYSLEDLKGFAVRLGLRSSYRKKIEVIEAIQKLRQDMGM
jgi:hypothetical protein